MEEKKIKKRIMTGIKPTNKLHLGNYIGAIKQIQEMQNNPDLEIFLFVPDLHSLTDEYNSIYDVMKAYIGICGEDITYYVQSQHKAIPYIAWILSCCTPYGELKRMTQFKSKTCSKTCLEINEIENSINSGYLYYPILMAADILSIDADIVPVGIDQKQHIELTRDICSHFKKKFKKDIFKKPQAMIAKAIKIMSLQDASKKMSKSDENSMATIFLNDSAEIVERKIRRAKTDSEKMPDNVVDIRENRPEIYNLCLIYREISGKDSFNEIETLFKGKNISEFKIELIVKLNLFLSEIQKKMNTVTMENINQILQKDYEKVSRIIENKLKIIENIVFQKVFEKV